MIKQSSEDKAFAFKKQLLLRKDDIQIIILCHKNMTWVKLFCKIQMCRKIKQPNKVSFPQKWKTCAPQNSYQYPFH